MQRFMLKSKLHRAVVTDANLHYEGSITIDEGLLEAADIIPYEKVAIYNVTNGELHHLCHQGCPGIRDDLSQRGGGPSGIQGGCDHHRHLCYRRGFGTLGMVAQMRPPQRKEPDQEDWLIIRSYQNHAGRAPGRPARSFSSVTIT